MGDVSLLLLDILLLELINRPIESYLVLAQYVTRYKPSTTVTYPVVVLIHPPPPDCGIFLPE